MSAIPTFMPGAEPFYYPGGDTGCLCIHGFMSSPGEVRWLGEYLAAQGMTVNGIRLSGHGTDYRDMTRVRWQDWLADVLDGYTVLRAQCGQVFVVGHSMGGTLALLLAAHVPVDGVVALATPVQFRSWRMASIRWLKYVIRYTRQGNTSDLDQRVREEQARRGEPVLGRIRYHLRASGAVAQLGDVTRATYACLPQVTAPLLLMYAARDDVVSPCNAEVIAARVNSETVEKHILEKTGHNLPLDCERMTVYHLVADFIKRHRSPGG